MSVADETPVDQGLAIEIIAEERVYDGFRDVDVIRYREADRGPERDVRREIMRARDAVAVVAWDPRLERLVLIRQFRVAAHLANGHGMTVEVVAGLIENGDEEGTVLNELREEAGLTATRIERLCTTLTSPGMSDERLAYWFAEVDASDLVAQAGLDEETEETFPFTCTLAEALAAVDGNQVSNGIAMFAILHFARHFERLTNG